VLQVTQGERGSMQVWVAAENAPELHSAVKTDIRHLLIKFVNEKSSDFTTFKKSWSALGMSRLHHLCPRAVTPPFFLQIIYQNVLDLLHDLPADSMLSPALPTCLYEVLWNMGILYTLHTLHYTRLIENSDTKIRVSPQAWTELLVASERLALFPVFASQALRIFRLLVSNDVIQYAMLTGVPTLYRIKAFIKEVSQNAPSDTSRPSLSTCVANTKLIREDIDTYANVMKREVRHAPVHTTMSTSSSSSSSTSTSARTLGTSTALHSDHDHGTVEDSSLLDFFNSQPPEMTKNPPSAPHTTTSSSSSVSVMAALEALEASTNEVFSDATVSTPYNEPISTQLPKRGKKRRHIARGTADKATRKAVTSRKKPKSISEVKAPTTTRRGTKRKSDTKESLSDDDLPAQLSGAVGNSAVKEPPDSAGGEPGSILDLLAQLERDSEQVLKSYNS